MTRKRISVIGLGNLGLPLAVTFAQSQFSVTAMDIDEQRINKIRKGIAPFEESGLQEALQNTTVMENLFPTTNILDAIQDNIASFIVVNTPSREDGSFSLKFVLSAAENIGKALQSIKHYHVIVLVSTVSPNNCEDQVIPLLESYSNKKCGIDFGFVHNPEFVALGSVINDMLHPDFRVIGEFDEKSGDIIEEIYQQVSDDPIIRMSIANAEFTKIALNCFLTLKISFANTLAEICQKLKGGNVDLVSETLGYDKRVSGKFLRAGLGFGGPCFPRDNKAFIAIANRYNCQSYISEAVTKVNDIQVSLALKKIKAIPEVKRITALGLSYKPDVPYVVDSQALEIVNKLTEDQTYSLAVYDPQAMQMAKKVLGNKVKYANSLKEALDQKTDLFLILTPWKEFSNIDFKDRNVLNFWKAT